MRKGTYHAVCCQAEFTPDQINHFLATAYAGGKAVEPSTEEMLIIVDDLAKTYLEPTLEVASIDGFPFEGKSEKQIGDMLQAMAEKTQSDIAPTRFVVLDEESKSNSSALLVVHYGDGRIESVRAVYDVCNIELIVLWVGKISMPELQELAEKQPDGLLRMT